MPRARPEPTDRSNPGALALLILLSVTLLGSGCVYFPTIVDKPESFALPTDPNSRLAIAMREASQEASRALLVEDADLALTSRLDLIDAADHSIDLQYFIWQNDPSGVLVLEKILAAADRGVRVRALLDDVQLEGLTNQLIAMDKHPNLEVRIFNPFSVRMRYRLRLLRLAEFAIDGNRLNHRMHNKLLIADGQLAILGGRNIGDDYFGRSEERNFIDTDIMLSGDAVAELADGFDDYWNSRMAYPIRNLINLSIFRDSPERVRRRVRRRVAEHEELDARAADTSFDDTIAKWATAPVLDSSTTVIDDPSVSWLDRPDEIAAQLADVTLTAEREVLISSPYLIPTRNLLGVAQTLIDRGVKITAITNSLATNDVVIAQSAYSNFRDSIVESGVELYEFRGDARLAEHLGSKDISLHSKYIIVDDETVFVGSTNLDPRSLYLNTELGVVLTSKALADQLRSSFETFTNPENAWRVVVTPDRTEWHSSAGIVDKPPAKSAWQRFRYRLLRYLPLSNQL